MGLHGIGSRSFSLLKMLIVDGIEAFFICDHFTFHLMLKGMGVANIMQAGEKVAHLAYSDHFNA